MIFCLIGDGSFFVYSTMSKPSGMKTDDEETNLKIVINEKGE